MPLAEFMLTQDARQEHKVTLSCAPEQLIRFVLTPIRVQIKYALPVYLRINVDSISLLVSLVNKSKQRKCSFIRKYLYLFIVALKKIKLFKDKNANVVYAPYTFWRGNNETILRRLFADGFIFRFIRSNVKNNDYFEAIQEIYNHFKYLETCSFSDIFIRRIHKKNVAALLNRIYDSEKRKRIILLTDIDSGINGYTCIDKTGIAAFPDKENYIFIPVYEKDWLAREALAELTVSGLRYHFLPLWDCPSTRFSLTDQITYEILKDEMNNNPKGHYSPADYENISQALLATKNLQGAYVEIGVYQGASA
jgi:hypothetical protein